MLERLPKQRYKLQKSEMVKMIPAVILRVKCFVMGKFAKDQAFKETVQEKCLGNIGPGKCNQSGNQPNEEIELDQAKPLCKDEGN